MAVHLAPGIDKFRIGRAIKGEEFPDMCERLKIMSEYLGIPYTYLDHGSGIGLSIPDTHFGMDAYLAVRTMYGKSYRVSYDLNGTRVTEAGVQALQEASDKHFALLDSTHCDLRSAFRHGEFTYLELYRDFPWKSFSDLLIHQHGSHESEVYAGTQYSGVFGGPSRMVMYDKSYQLAKKGKKGILDSLIRIERKIASPLSLLDVLDLEKPFEKVMIFDIKKLEKLNVNPVGLWLIFIESAKCDGIATALSKESPYRRKLFRKALAAGQVDWFDPMQWHSTWGEKVIKGLCLENLFKSSLSSVQN